MSVLRFSYYYMVLVQLATQEFKPDAVLRTATLEASTAFQPDGQFQVSIDASPNGLPKDYALPLDEPAIDLTGFANAPPMNVNIMIVGSRGLSYHCFCQNYT
jgi:hypothetical protein